MEESFNKKHPIAGNVIAGVVVSIIGFVFRLIYDSFSNFNLLRYLSVSDYLFVGAGIMIIALMIILIRRANTVFLQRVILLVGLLMTFVVAAQLPILQRVSITIENANMQNDEYVYAGRVSLVSDIIPHDKSDDFLIYNGNDKFYMSGKEYDEGYTNKNRWGTQAYFECDKKYSKLIFVAGHVDNSGNGSKTITIEYLGEDGSYKNGLTIELNEASPTQEYVIDIHNTQTIRILTNTTGPDARFGIANPFLTE